MRNLRSVSTALSYLNYTLNIPDGFHNRPTSHRQLEPVFPELLENRFLKPDDTDPPAFWSSTLKIPETGYLIDVNAAAVGLHENGKALVVVGAGVASGTGA